jgi:hypothetical protein
MASQVLTEIHFRRVSPVQLVSAIAIGNDDLSDVSPILAEAEVVAKIGKLH